LWLIDSTITPFARSTTFLLRREPFSIGLEELCYCDLNWPLRIAVFDWEKSGDHRRIGEFEVTTNKLIERIGIRGNADRKQAFELVLDEKAKLKGLLCVLKAEVVLEDPSKSPDQQERFMQAWNLGDS